MIATCHRQTGNELVNTRHALQVLGVLSLMIKTVSPETSLGIILQQARSEVASLLQSQHDMPKREAA